MNHRKVLGGGGGGKLDMGEPQEGGVGGGANLTWVNHRKVLGGGQT